MCLVGYGLLWDKGKGRLTTHMCEHGRFCVAPCAKKGGFLTPLELKSSRDMSSRRSHIERYDLSVL
jgi:hypothetical protein